MVLTDAPAIIARQSIFYFRPGGMRVLVQQRLGHHENSRCAETALECVFIDEHLLEIRQLPGPLIGKTLYCCDMFSITFNYE